MSFHKVTVTPYCVGPRIVSVPIAAPTAAPAELGEALCMTIGFVGSGGSAVIEVKPGEAKTRLSSSICLYV